MIAVDPGKRAIGYCSFDEARGLIPGRLLSCGFYEFSTHFALGTWLRERFDRAVCELPRSAVLSKRSMAIQNDVLDVSLTAGAVAGVLPTAFIRPSGWKRLVDKEIHQPRILKALRARPEGAEILAQLDLIKASIRHNTIDAVGIAIWYLDEGPGSRAAISP